MKVKVIWILTLLATALISILSTSYFYESKEKFNKEMHDFHALIEVLCDIENISELQSGVIYQDTIEEKYFDDIRHINRSRYVYSKFRSIHDELDRISYLVKEPLSEGELKYLQKIVVELKEYINDFNEYASIEDYNIYLPHKSFDADAKRLQEIFCK
ncbi:hypothetical protein [Cellulosilyticum ruminicola]|uniref:hypothetical protein n=1 Tax=Cellulosilyticum ruminicola TaxID=425254 RepID=UPI0006D21672|nr:hypothetical protein [Cellulosilyticum ruminicola]